MNIDISYTSFSKIEIIFTENDKNNLNLCKTKQNYPW